MSKPDESRAGRPKEQPQEDSMNKLDLIIGLIILITMTVLLYIFTSFEITIIFLIVDMSVGISYQFDKIYRLLKKEANNERD